MSPAVAPDKSKDPFTVSSGEEMKESKLAHQSPSSDEYEKVDKVWLQVQNAPMDEEKMSDLDKDLFDKVSEEKDPFWEHGVVSAICSCQ